MKDTRSLLLLLVSLLLVLVSFGLLWTWGYRVYNKDNQLNKQQILIQSDSVSIANHIRDSLQEVYTSTLHELDNQLDSTLLDTDSLKNELDIKLLEFYRLRDEIAALLKNRNVPTDFKTAKKKINELQNKVQVIKVKNQEVENENKNLNAVLTKLNSSNADTKIKPATKPNSPKKESTVFPVFTASEMAFRSLTVNGDNESETSMAENTDKFTGSFAVKNFNSQLTNAEIFVVILQPDGRVLKTSGWDSGTFDTPEGRKIYSYKSSFKYSRGEAKRILFSIKVNNLSRGDYTMQVYYNGEVIARIVKSLF